MKKKLICFFVVCLYVLVMTVPAFAAIRPKVLFIPHDDRPVSFSQTAGTIGTLDYDLVTPPKGLLGNRQSQGNPDALWEWLLTAAKGADAVVLSSDTLLYGSLVGSRKHAYTNEEIMERIAHFERLKEENPRLKIYAFGSIMRSPRSSAGGEEPSYYAQYGPDIFMLTALEDKAETVGLGRKEQRQLTKLQKSVPSEAINDWMDRRSKNFAANLKLVDFARQDVFSYLALGLDDNAPFSQTHKERRLLDLQSGDLGASKFQTLAGIDEMGLVLLTRAVNDLRWDIPLVAIRYADGVGEKTIPTYSDEEIGKSIRSHLFAAGAIPVPTEKRADLILLVNTKQDGSTSEANYPDNTIEPKENTVSFVDMVESFLKRGYAVSIADIAYGNGADNALMAELNKRKLLPALASYSGWNTGNNSAGFAIGQGILSRHMAAADKNHLLAIRLMDDWAYQANVRQAVAGELAGMKGGTYSQLDQARMSVTRSANQKMNQFADAHLQQFAIEAVRVDFPWNRMFETNVELK